MFVNKQQSVWTLALMMTVDTLDDNMHIYRTHDISNYFDTSHFKHEFNYFFLVYCCCKTLWKMKSNVI